MRIGTRLPVGVHAAAMVLYERRLISEATIGLDGDDLDVTAPIVGAEHEPAGPIKAELAGPPPA